eukprot:TRINITY_DN556_c0_g1_i1.p1 TRINITY_DN556_c0_g1~~TRINITY_DN556_c0_g1_i1.p1  ORF type:complete len:180 (-),score=23.55 TRINITY_DN556_c0_g1_i1:26-565(-)
MEQLSVESIVGARVRLVTIVGDTVTGEVYAFDPQSQCLVLQDKSDALPVQGRAPVNLQFVKTNSVRDIQVISAQQAAPDLRIPHVNLQRLVRREERAVDKARERAAQIGMGVSTLAQQVFDALAKTLPCTWVGDRIIVMNEAVISKPYTSESITCANDTLLTRVKMVLQRERQKIDATT